MRPACHCRPLPRQPGQPARPSVLPACQSASQSRRPSSQPVRQPARQPVSQCCQSVGPIRGAVGQCKQPVGQSCQLAGQSVNPAGRPCGLSVGLSVLSVCPAHQGSGSQCGESLSSAAGEWPCRCPRHRCPGVPARWQSGSVRGGSGQTPGLGGKGGERVRGAPRGAGGAAVEAEPGDAVASARATPAAGSARGGDAWLLVSALRRRAACPCGSRCLVKWKG